MTKEPMERADVVRTCLWYGLDPEGFNYEEYLRWREWWESLPDPSDADGEHEEV